MTKLKRKLERMIEPEDGLAVVMTVMPSGALWLRPKYGRTGSERVLDVRDVFGGLRHGDELGLFKQPNVRLRLEGGAWVDDDGYEWSKKNGVNVSD